MKNPIPLLLVERACEHIELQDAFELTVKEVEKGVMAKVFKKNVDQGVQVIDVHRQGAKTVVVRGNPVGLVCI